MIGFLCLCLFICIWRCACVWGMLERNRAKIINYLNPVSKNFWFFFCLWGGILTSPQILQIKCNSWGLDIVWSKCQDPMPFFIKLIFTLKSEVFVNEVVWVKLLYCVCVCMGLRVDHVQYVCMWESLHKGWFMPPNAVILVEFIFYFTKSLRNVNRWPSAHVWASDWPNSRFVAVEMSTVDWH